MIRRALALAAGALFAVPAVGQVSVATGQVTTTDVQTAIAAASVGAVKTVNGAPPDGTGNVAIPTTTFASGFTPTSPGTIANLMANAPCNAARLASYAVVSDLYSGTASTNEVMRCTQSGVLNYWRPQRTEYAATVTFTGGTLTLNPLYTPPILYLTGTMTSNGAITPSSTFAYPGQQFTVVELGTLGLFSVQVGGLVGAPLSLVTGGTRTMTYVCTAAGSCGWQGN